MADELIERITECYLKANQHQQLARKGWLASIEIRVSSLVDAFSLALVRAHHAAKLALCYRPSTQDYFGAKFGDDMRFV
jgi:hypothetical protein